MRAHTHSCVNTCRRCCVFRAGDTVNGVKDLCYWLTVLCEMVYTNVGLSGSVGQDGVYLNAHDAHILLHVCL